MTSEVYVIHLISRYTGESAWLGMKHPSKEQAQAYANREVCSRCWRHEIYPAPDSSVWRGRKEGFCQLGGGN
jgi:hypothetical protein